jgi:hypothetical protein
MQLMLKYPATPENASRFAADIADAARNVSGVHLDLSPKSLSLVDNILEELRADGLAPNQIAETLFGFGCYVGEVFVRNGGGKWKNTDDTQLKGLGGFSLVVELPSGAVCNPIGKAFKRLENGAEDSLEYFYQVFTSSLALRG